MKYNILKSDLLFIDMIFINKYIIECIYAIRCVDLIIAHRYITELLIMNYKYQ